MKPVIYLGLIIFGGWILAGCALSGNPSSAPEPVPVVVTSPKFGLAYDYSMLKPVKTDIPGARIFNYNDPQLKSRQYDSVIIEPVVFYQGLVNTKLGSTIAANSRASLQQYLKRIIGDKLKIVNVPGVNVVTLKLMIAGARLESESGYKPAGFIPIEQVLGSTRQKSTVVDSPPQALEIGVRINDSLSGKLLGVAAVSLKDNKLKEDINGSDSFQRILEMWSAIAVKYAANYKVVR